MKEEIENHEETMSEMTIESERLKKELQNFKKKFFFQKKENSKTNNKRKHRKTISR